MSDDHGAKGDPSAPLVVLPAALRDCVGSTLWTRVARGRRGRCRLFSRGAPSGGRLGWPLATGLRRSRRSARRTVAVIAARSALVVATILVQAASMRNREGAEHHRRDRTHEPGPSGHRRDFRCAEAQPANILRLDSDEAALAQSSSATNSCHATRSPLPTCRAVRPTCAEGSAMHRATRRRA